MKKILLLSLLIFVPSAVFAQCNTTNVYDDITCYETELKNNKAKLNQTYQKLYNTMDEEGKKILETSQKNWLLYKNSHCDELVSYVSREALGGGSTLINLSCNVELTKARIQQLKDLE